MSTFGGKADIDWTSAQSHCRKSGWQGKTVAGSHRTRVDGLILWANSFLLFWLSLIPAATAWMGENFLVPIPTALYGGILLMPAIAYYLLQRAILRK